MAETSLPLGTALLCFSASLIFIFLGACSIICGLVLTTIGYNADFGDKPLKGRLLTCKNQRVNRKLPWRPRNGELMPDKRDDYYPRWLLEVRPLDETLQVGLRQWTYSARSGWRQNTFELLEEVADDDMKALGDARAKAECLRDRRTDDERERWYSSRSLDVPDCTLNAELQARRQNNRLLAETLSD